MIDLPDVRLAAIAPELALSVTALLLLLVDAVFKHAASRPWLLWLSTLGLVAAGYLAVTGYADKPDTELAGMVALDGFATFVKVTLVVFGVLSVWLSHDYLSRHQLEESEFYALLLFAAAGMMLMASAADLIVVFIALEMFSISLYVLVGFRRRSLESQEAAMKYFLLGSFSSAFFLAGIALAYGAVGSTNLYSGIAAFLNTSPGSSGGGLLVLATGMLIVGLGFKVDRKSVV